jgi:tetratricopeptide (TPR) repeat protein
MLCAAVARGQPASTNPVASQECAEGEKFLQKRPRQWEDLRQAFFHFNQAIRADANCTAAYCGRGYCYRFYAKTNFALADYNSAIRLDPTYAPAYEGRGLVYVSAIHALKNSAVGPLTPAQKKQLPTAIADFTEAIRLDPNYTEAYQSRACAYADANEYEKAIADQTEAIRLGPVTPDLYFNRSIFYKAAGRTSEAEEDTAEAVRLQRSAQ